MGRYICPPGLPSTLDFVNVGDDTDDAGLRVADENDAADGVFAGQEIVRCGLVEDDGLSPFMSSCPGEVAAVEAHSHGGDVTGGDDVDEGSFDFAGTIGLAFEARASPAAVALEREVVGDSGCLYTGNGVDAAEYLLEVCALLLDFGFVISP